MIAYLLHNGEKRPIKILYSNKTTADIAYKNIFDRAEKELGIKTTYIITAKDETATVMPARHGTLDVQTIKVEIPDYFERTFYISGPQGMVTSLKNLLLHMGVKRTRIVTDYFPGFA
jgi:ferredoxin-NADP reductase